MATRSVGGVCAHLDYEVDQMADYVSEMAQRLVMPSSAPSPAFRKFCSGILSSTRLPSTTVLLGMNYLARRMHIINDNDKNHKATEGQVWRMLTIGFLLGSKFLDDNTFQNRSWSEVSGIAVSELNTLEVEWLESIHWNLYVNLDLSTDYQAWLQSWAEWRETKNLQRANTLERLAPLAPIDTNVQRTRPYPQQYSGYSKSTSPARSQSSFNNPRSAFNNSIYEHNGWYSYPTPHHTPPSAPDSEVNTPEYNMVMSATGGAPRYNDWAVYNPYSNGGYQSQSAYVAPTQNPMSVAIAEHWMPHLWHDHHRYVAPNVWDGRAATADCSCVECNPHMKQQHQPFFANHGYGQQIAA
jgi:ribulose bisphosphate carboxylase small subunit